MKIFWYFKLWSSKSHKCWMRSRQIISMNSRMRKIIILTFKPGGKRQLSSYLAHRVSHAFLYNARDDLILNWNIRVTLCCYKLYSWNPLTHIVFYLLAFFTNQSLKSKQASQQNRITHEAEKIDIVWHAKPIGNFEIFVLCWLSFPYNSCRGKRRKSQAHKMTWKASIEIFISEFH